MKKILIMIFLSLFFTGTALGANGDPVLEGKTATGNITTSATLQGEHIISTDDADINDNLTVGDIIVDEATGVIDFTSGTSATISATGANALILLESVTIGDNTDNDFSLTFDGDTSDGVLNYDEDNANFEFDQDVTTTGVATGEHIVSTDDADINDNLTVGDIIVDEAAGVIDFTGVTSATISATGANALILLESVTIGDNTDNDFSLTFDGDTSNGTINYDEDNADFEFDQDIASTGNVEGATLTYNGNEVYRATGTDVPVTDGGTGVSTLADGGLVIGNATGNVEVVAAGTATQVLVGGGANTAPVWGTDIPTAVTIGAKYIYRADGTDVPVTDGGTGAGTFTDGGLLVGAGTSPLEALAVGLATEVLVGGGAGTNPAWGTDLPTAVTIGGAEVYRVGGTDVAATDGGTGKSSWTQYAIPYAPTTTTIGEVTPAASSVLVTDGSNIPSLATDIPTAVTIGSAYIYRVGGTDVAVADGGTGAGTASAGFDALSPMTTVGDLIYGGASGTGTRLAAGATTEILVGGGAAAPVWTTATGTGAPMRGTSPTVTTELEIGADDAIAHIEVHDAGTIKMRDDSDDTTVTIGPVADGTNNLGITGGLVIANTSSVTSGDLTLGNGNLVAGTSGKGVDYSATDHGFVRALAFSDGGTGYTSGSLVFTGGGGTGAAGTFVAAAGIITSVTLTSAGTGYTSAPSVDGDAGGNADAVITANVAVMSSELLDYYEEGTFTPILTTTGVDFTSVTYDVNRGGRYTRIGNLVHIQFYMKTDAVTAGGANGTVVIEGMPYTAVDNATGSTRDGWSSLNVSFCETWTGENPIAASMEANSTRVALYYRGAVDGDTVATAVADVNAGVNGNKLRVAGTYIAQ